MHSLTELESPKVVKRAEKKGRSTPNREQIKTARNNLVSLKLVSADGSHIKLPGKIKKRIEDLKVGSVSCFPTFLVLAKEWD